MTVVAVVLLVASLGVVWQIADVRAEQAASAKADDLVNQQVPARQAPTDYDGDGVNDSSDACPTRAETTNGFQDGDGCPDVVATTGAS
ncbi:thrombospondin type 3 repeat-containing protein [Halobacteriaceae archaeon GCM10025711]